MPKPWTDAGGEAASLDEEFFRTARRGRPALTEGERKRRVNVTLDPEVLDAARGSGEPLSVRINRLLRADLGL